MTETIVVAYRPIGFNYHHKYIIYNSVNSDGLTTAYYGAGGPDAYFDLSNEGNTAYGAIDTYTGEYSPILENDYDNPDYTDQTHPSEVIIEGDDLGAYWDLIVEAMDLIKAANTADFPTGLNSNSVVDTAISYAGLTEPTRDSGDPNRPGRSHANLRLWIDEDSDGIRDDGELHTLDTFGVVSSLLASNLITLQLGIKNFV